MRNKTVTIIFIVNLAAMVLLAIFFPHLMISPGKLIDAHVELATDCFACHTPFVGSTSEKCTVCHKVEEIGIKTTNGLHIAMENKNVAFHQKLIEENCVACHSDHKGVKAFRPISQFSHNLLDPALRKQCDTCHRSPGDALHQKVMWNCSQCHTLESWIPATFEHEEYFRSVGNKECTGCHREPDDRLHRQLKGNCDTCHSLDKWKPATLEHEYYFGSVGNKECTGCHLEPDDHLHRQLKGKCDTCHSLDKWKPATFDHDKYFRFDKDHQTECVTCHVNNDYAHYTCYGCHEHSRSGIRKEHVKEGIKDYENCVECHRSGDEDEAERIWKSKRGGYRRDHDDKHGEEDDD